MNYEKYNYILENNKIDKDFEYFWCCLKEYINRLIMNYPNNSNSIVIYNNKNKELSILLNKLQAQNNIIEIQYKIQQFIYDIALLIIDQQLYSELNLILTYIKRWNTIKNNKHKINFINKNINNKQILVIIKIFNILLKKTNIDFYNKTINVINKLNDDYDNNNKILIQFAKLSINNKKYGIITILNNTINIVDLINDNMNEKIDNTNISILKLINKYYNKINWKDI